MARRTSKRAIPLRSIEAVCFSAGTGPGGAQVRRRSGAHRRAEVAAEVRLVEPAKRHREPCEVFDLSGVDRGGGVLQAEAREHRLGADPDPLREQALQRAHTHPGPPGHVVDAHKVAVGEP